MAETESRKKEIAKDFIEKNVLNKELVETQGSFLKELNSLKKEIESFKDFSILGSEDTSSSSETQQDEKIFGMDEMMKLLFNNKGKQRTKIGYEAKKMINMMYLIISDEGKKNLDLLYESLQKSKTEQELKQLLSNDLNQLQSEILGNGNNGYNGNQNENYNRNGGENLSSVENKKENQVSEQYIYKQAKMYGVIDNRQIAYILATVKGECGFKNIKEIGGENKDYGKDGYYGRGFVQLTHRGNYEKFTKIIKESKLKFKDNDGNILTSQQLDLVKNPDIITKSNNLASFILIYGMKNGTFTGKKLNDYINDKGVDYYNARRIINGISSSPEKYKNYAEEYLSKIGNGSNNNIEKQNKNNILTEGSPDLLADNNLQLGGLGNSMMTGFQGGYNQNKKKFPNMDGVEGKSTQTHPRRFKSKQDVTDYKNNHPDIKSFMFYFGANTRDNKQTLKDITKRGEWMQEVGIQPVLCTCIGEDNHPWLTELNQMIIQKGKEKNWPVLDFAKEYNNGEIAMGNKKHPTSEGYNKMSDLINESLV